MKFKIILLILFTFMVIDVKAQDPIFTQAFLVPETMNPAFAGYLYTLHGGLIHRRQWPDGNRRLDTDFAFINKDITDQMGLGISVLNHHEDFTNYNYLQLNFAYSYVVEIDSDWFLRFGIEPGFGVKSFNFKSLLLEDQINVGNGSINGPSNDPSILNNLDKIIFFDLSTGFLLHKENFRFGASLKHLTRPNISFEQDKNTPLDMFLSLHSRYAVELNGIGFRRFPADSKLLFYTNYMRQGQYNRLDIGSGISLENFTFGANLAANLERKSSNSHLITSVNPFVSLKLDHFVFRYSYDANTSKIGNTQGIHELSLTWRLDLESTCRACSTYIVEE
jgi:type IX secretion system PorP/SprF family membrane protein